MVRKWLGRGDRREVNGKERGRPLDEAGALAYLDSLERFGSRLGLERMTELLGRLGHPQRRLRYVHVAGSNGKGSVTAMVTSILRTAGYRAGMYISPHLERFHERISVDGREISGPDLARHATRVRSAVEAMTGAGGEHPTQFEAVTAIAFDYFQRQGADPVVLEVGLGGREDATNAIDESLVSVITPLSLEHTDRLGPTLADIAAAKAGIIKTGGMVVSAPQDPGAEQVIAREAAAGGARLLWAGRDFTWRRTGQPEGQVFDYRGILGHEYRDLCIALLGKHQVDNAALAVATAEALILRGLDIDERSIRQGLAAARWPGRLEVISRRPLVILDGAHNPDGFRVLDEALVELCPDRRIILVCGVLKDKDLSLLMRGAMSRAETVIATRPESGRARPVQELAEMARGFTANVLALDDLTEALDLALDLAGPDDAVVVAGSLYLAGPARSVLRDRLQQDWRR